MEARFLPFMTFTECDCGRKPTVPRLLMCKQTHCLSAFSSLSISPIWVSLSFFSGRPCAVSVAYVVHDEHTWVQWEVVKPTCTLPCFDLPAMCAGPGDALIALRPAINAHYKCVCASPWSPCSHRSISLAQGNGLVYGQKGNTHRHKLN